MTEKVIKILTHVAAGIGGATIGGSIVFAATRKKYYTDVESIRTYYRSKKNRVVDVPKKDIPVEEKSEISLGSEDIRQEFLTPPPPANFIDYRSFSRASQEPVIKNDIVDVTPANPDEPYEIEASDYGTLEGYDTKTYTHFSNGVITDEEFNVVDNPEDILGDYNKYLEQDNYQSVVYIRNSTTMVDYCLSPVDKPFYE